MEKKNRLAPLERSWILYDIGNSAYILLVATLLPIYFNALMTGSGIRKEMYLSYWADAGAVATVLVAILGPICGTLADQKGFKKPIFLICAAVGILGCAALGVTANWLLFLGIFILSKVGFNASIAFCDSMLPEVTPNSRMDKVSTMGYAYGYIGPVIPFVLCLVLVGMFLVGRINQLTIGMEFSLFGLRLQHENLAVGALVILFIIGFILFCKADKLCRERVNT